MADNSMGIRGRAAVVGIGATAQGELPGRTADEIAVIALSEALADAGIGKTEIDGLITCRAIDGSCVDTTIGRMAGLNPSYSATLDYGSCNFSLHVAAMAIVTGMATTVALVYGTNPRTNRHNFGAPYGAADFTAPQGFVHIAGPAAVAFNRHRYLYGTTEEQLAHVAIVQREYAQTNPLAIFKSPLTLESYLASPKMVGDLRRADITMVSDGGVSVIVTASDHVGAFKTKPAYVRAIAQHAALREEQNADNFMRPWLATVASRLYRAADLTCDDVDVLYVQDPTSVWVLQALEGYGFCGPGEAGPFLEDGQTRLDGRIPTNTNGGQLSESYMWGWLHLCEAVRQLRGECGERQVAGARIAQYCSTMAFQKGAATILGNEP